MIHPQHEFAAMDCHVIGLRARAEGVRRLAERATIQGIRIELLAIAAQYDELADGIAVADRPPPTSTLGGSRTSPV